MERILQIIHSNGRVSRDGVILSSQFFLLSCSPILSRPSGQSLDVIGLGSHTLGLKISGTESRRGEKHRRQLNGLETQSWSVPSPSAAMFPGPARQTTPRSPKLDSKLEISSRFSTPVSTTNTSNSYAGPGDEIGGTKCQFQMPCPYKDSFVSGRYRCSSCSCSLCG